MALTPEQKHPRAVQDMFARIAGRYDLMNRLMTAGRDQAWRRRVVDLAALPSGGCLLDLGSGTGAIAFEALRRRPDALVVGADFTLEMMRLGQRRAAPTPAWVGADALRLPFPENTFDAVTSGFLMRNVVDVEAGFAEQRRVVKPGGRVVCLETSPPPDNALRPFIDFYLQRVIPVLGHLVTGQAEAYRYLPASTRAFLTPEALGAIMEGVGLRQVRYERWMFGTIAILVGVK
jgi:demethylmenaquinone methyltransferase/2-methoxy-6-polyprenyl-1,4-benzoquinol methylase